MRTLDQVVSGEEWIRLNERYRVVFGEGIPTMELPADGDAALALILRAIESRDESVFGEGVPPGALV